MRRSDEAEGGAVARLHVRDGVVRAVEPLRPGLWQLAVDLGGGVEPALLLDGLTRVPEVGERVAVNTTAVDLGLGTGGFHFVLLTSRPERDPAMELGESRPDGDGPDDPAGSDTGARARTGRGRKADPTEASPRCAGPMAANPREAGHIMKLRYTPLQIRVLAAEEPASPHHGVLAGVRDLGGMPVVVVELHSQLAPAAAALRLSLGPGARIVYVMTDGGALPLVYSRLAAQLRETGFLDGTVTVGHAFGGDLEAVTVFSGLLAARWALGADAAVVAMGPGVVGTGTAFGTTAIETGQHLDAAGILGGRAVAALRLSFADPRARHRGVSHHSLTALGVIAQRPCRVAVPRLADDEERLVRSQLDGAGIPARHRLVDEARGQEALDALADRGVALRSMGRTPAEDPAPFLAAAAAGYVAADLLLGGEGD